MLMLLPLSYWLHLGMRNDRNLQMCKVTLVYDAEGEFSLSPSYSGFTELILFT
jgi:hypothetical protein